MCVSERERASVHERMREKKKEREKIVGDQYEEVVGKGPRSP